MPDWRSEARERVKEKSEGSTLKLMEGENCCRILPDKKDILPDGKVRPKGCVHKPYREFKIHRDVGPEEAMLACGYTIKGEGACWLCDVKIPELEASGNPIKLKKARNMTSREAFMCMASKYDADTKKFTAPKRWWVSTGNGMPGRQGESLAVRIFSKLSSSKKDYVDPIKGYNLNITRTGQGIKTRYPEMESDDKPTTVPPNILKQIEDLDKAVPVYDEEDMKAAYFGKQRKRDREEAAAATEEEEETPETAEEETAEEDTEAADEEAAEETAEEEAETEEAEEEATEEEAEEEASEEEAAEEEAAEEEEFEAEAETDEELEEEPIRPAKKKNAAPPPKKAAATKKTAPPPKKKVAGKR